jgi:hypothetical protein
MNMVSKRAAVVLTFAGLLYCLGGVPLAGAQSATVQVTIKNHRFQPAEVNAPANTPLTIRVKNLDPTPMEFESKSLRVEKVVPGNGEGSINVRALAPGSYKFFDDFNQATGQGVLVVK